MPPTAVSPDLVALAGGPERVIARAQGQLSEGRPLHALHLAEAALAAQPACADALRVKLQATEYLLAHSSRENFSEVRWLEAQAGNLRRALAETTA